MAVEQFANNRSSTLNGSINNSVTTVTVNDGSVFPSTGQYRVIVDTEIMLVTARSGNDLTVTRGAEGTSAASHSNGAALTLILTAGALDQRTIDECGAGAIGSRPSTGKEGRLYLPDSGLTMHRDTGAVWTPYGLLHKFKQPPSSGSWTWVNQGGATLADQGGTLLLTDPAHSSENARILKKAAPGSTPYTITAAFRPFIDNPGTGSRLSFGLCVRESSSGKLLWVGFYFGGTGRQFVHTVFKYSSPTLFTSFVNSYQYGGPSDVMWCKYEDDGANRKCYVSCDGVNWGLVLSESRTTHLTADEVGFVFNNNYASGTPFFDGNIRLLSWDES